MKILIFGAGGGVGHHLVQQALDYGDEVWAVMRTNSTPPTKTQGLHILHADVLIDSEVKAVIQEAGLVDAVASCLNTHQGVQPGNELARMLANITAAMQHHGLKRMVYCASAGIEGELAGERGQAAMHFLRHPLADHKAAIAHIHQAHLDATIIRPVGLADGAASGHYFETGSGLPPQGSGRVLRADVASLMLKALHDDAYIGSSVAISN